LKALQITSIVTLLIGVSLSSSGSSQPTRYAELFQRALNTCLDIPFAESHSDFWFSPDGDSSRWGRSACLQKMAINFRDEALCDKVWRRYSLFNSSSHTSEAACRSKVQKKQQKDVDKLTADRQQYDRSPTIFTSLTIKNPISGDKGLSLVPAFSGAYPHRYVLKVWLTDKQRRDHLIHERLLYLGLEADGVSSIWIATEDIQDVVHEYELGAPYPWRADLIFPASLYGHGGAIHPDWFEQMWPESSRTTHFDAGLMPPLLDPKKHWRNTFKPDWAEGDRPQ
jgi:hypothetical protein